MSCFRLIYENDNFIVVSKPQGLLVMKARGGASGEANLTDLLKEKYPSVFRVHRIDRDTSGIVVFAKNFETFRYLNSLFEKRNIIKKYLAVVWGNIDKKLIIDRPVYEFSSGRCGISEKGKFAITEVKPIKYFKDFTLVEVKPLTGRRHQIRVHLYSINHPVVGDLLYGDRQKQVRFKRMFLHSYYLSFSFKGNQYQFNDISYFVEEVNETFGVTISSNDIK